MKTFFTFILLFAGSFTYGQELKATVNDLSFMAGTWTQKHEWGDMEEFWGKPMGNCIVSNFRCVKDGKILFYEFVVVEQGENVPVLKLRHFNPGSIGWEDKTSPLEFPLTYLDNNKAVFELRDKSIKMTYSVTVKSKMNIILEEKNKEGAWSTTTFNFAYSRD